MPHIAANGGVDGSEGGLILFAEKTKGGTASITLNGNAELDISERDAPGVTIGSLSWHWLGLSRRQHAHDRE